MTNFKKYMSMFESYENEQGHSHQVLRLAKYSAEVRRFTYY